MGNTAIATDTNNNCWRHAPDTIKFSDTQLRRDWSAEIIQFPKRPVAEIADVNVECVRLWRAGDRLPSLTNTLNLCRVLPSVSRWVGERSGHKSTRVTSIAGVLADLSALADRQDSEGAKARMILMVARSIDAKVDAVDPRLRGLHEAVEQLLPEWVR